MSTPAILLRETVLIMSELIYLISVLLSLAAYAVGIIALWGAVEGVYYLYCKVTGRDY